MDQYQFALTVDWDQKDHDTYQAKTAAFFEELAKLNAEESLSKDEILAAAVIGYTIWLSSTHECVAYAERWECYAPSNCNDWRCTSNQICSWINVCTQ